MAAQEEGDCNYYLHRKCRHRMALYIDTDRFSGPVLHSLRKSYRHNLLEKMFNKIYRSRYRSRVAGTFCEETGGEQG